LSNSAPRYQVRLLDGILCGVASDGPADRNQSITDLREPLIECLDAYGRGT